jgi:uncharacterized protein (UPF0332 family)
MEVKELVKRLKEEEKKGNLKRAIRYTNWSQEHMNKAEFNLLSARIEYLLLTNESVRKSSELFSNYDKFDWLIIKSYYSMYHAVLALLAEIGFKTETHFATIASFELFFVRRNKLVKEKFLQMLIEVMDRVGTIPYDYVRMIIKARKIRYVAQYDVTTSIIKREAKDSFEKAIVFIEEMKRVYNRLKEIKKSLDLKF